MPTAHVPPEEGHTWKRIAKKDGTGVFTGEFVKGKPQFEYGAQGKLYKTEAAAKAAMTRNNLKDCWIDDVWIPNESK